MQCKGQLMDEIEVLSRIGADDGSQENQEKRSFSQADRLRRDLM